MSRFQDYFDTQEKLYEEFRSATELLDEIRAYSSVTEPLAGYVIALRHPDEIVRPFSELAQQISQTVPCILYDENNAHTTMISYQVRSLLGGQSEMDIMDRLSGCVGEVRATAEWRQVRIQFRTWLFNSDTVIVAGYPNDDFWNLYEKLRDTARPDYHLAPPKMAHITAARFTAVRKGDAVRKLRRQLRHAPVLGESRPVAIDVGYFQCDAYRFEFKDRRSFS